MEGVLFMLGTFVIEGGLFFLLMSLITAGERQRGREEEARRRLTIVERRERDLRKAA
ncbi:MAG: hypothetical protein ACE5IZ_09140 [Dehalococcoidia bacterium]